MTTLSAITFVILIGATVGALVTVLAAAMISGRVRQEEEESGGEPSNLIHRSSMLSNALPDSREAAGDEYQQRN